MIPKLRLAAITAVSLGLVFGSQFAIAQESGQANSSQPGTAMQAISVTPPNNTGAISRPKDRVGTSYFSSAECIGLGGTVVDTNSKSCSETGKMCYRADQDGVIHKACITE